jgi:hypothetical protein
LRVATRIIFWRSFKGNQRRLDAAKTLTIANWPLPIISQERKPDFLRNNWQWPIGNGQWAGVFRLNLTPWRSRSPDRITL